MRSILRFSNSRLLLLAGGLLLAPLWIISQTPDEDWQLVSIEANLLEKRSQGPGFFLVDTDNPSLSGEIRFAGSGHDMRLRVWTDDQTSWERPIPSDWVRIPESRDWVILVGQHNKPGSIKDGHVVYEGLVALDRAGHEIGRLVETGPISRLELFPDGRLLYLSRNVVKLVDLAQAEPVVWSLDIDADDLELMAGGQYFVTGNWNAVSETYESRLYEAATGQLLRSVELPAATAPLFFDVSSDQEFVFLRKTVQTGPLVCELDVFRAGHWTEPAFSLTALPGAPFVADRDPVYGTLALGLLAVDPGGNPDLTRIHLELFNTSFSNIFSYTTGSGPVDWDRAYLNFTDRGAGLLLFFHSQEYYFSKE